MLKQREGRSPVWGAALSIYAVISRFAVPSKQLRAAAMASTLLLTPSLR